MEIGLFPLGMVLLPGEQVPLHIFEPRYRELIGECIEGDSVFGLILSDDEGTREVGTTAAVVDVLDRFDDGRMNVVVEGRERFRLLSETQGRAFRTGEIEAIPDDDGDVPSEEEVARCLAAFDALAVAAETEGGRPESEGEELSWWLATRVAFGPELKQELLELRSSRARLVRLAELFGRARATLAWAKTAEERAATNGRVEPPG